MSHQPSRLALVAVVLSTALLAPRTSRAETASSAEEPGAPRTSADDDEDGGSTERAAPRSRYRNPQGSVTAQLYLGVSSTNEETRVAFGAGLGYAVVTGVVPGVRGLIATGSGGLGGELALSLTLTPPIATSVTPFGVGEVGRRFEPWGAGWIYGAGLGVYLGAPSSSVALQLGWMFRWIDFGDSLGAQAIHGPIVALSVRF